MNKSFKIPLFKEWTVTEDCVIVGSERVPYSTITKVEYNGMPTSKGKNGVAQVWSGSKFYTLGYPYKQKEDGDAAIQFLMDRFYSANKKEIDDYNNNQLREYLAGSVMALPFSISIFTYIKLACPSIASSIRRGSMPI